MANVETIWKGEQVSHWEDARQLWLSDGGHMIGVLEREPATTSITVRPKTHPQASR